MLPLSPSNRSVRRKLAPFRSHLDVGDHLLDHCRVVLARLDAEQGRDALDHAARQRRCNPAAGGIARSDEHTSELQSLMRISYAVFCLKKKTRTAHYSTKLTVIT